MFPDFPVLPVFPVFPVLPEPDEPWSFLFRSFAIRPPALFGRTDNALNLCGAMPPLRIKKKATFTPADDFAACLRETFWLTVFAIGHYMGANTDVR